MEPSVPVSEPSAASSQPDDAKRAPDAEPAPRGVVTTDRELAAYEITTSVLTACGVLEAEIYDSSVRKPVHRIHALYASIQRAGAAAPPELKRLVADFARPLRQRGDTWAQVAAQLPVSVTTARAWLHAHPVETSLVAVSIRDDATSGAAIEALAEFVLVSLAGDRL